MKSQKNSIKTNFCSNTKNSKI